MINRRVAAGLRGLNVITSRLREDPEDPEPVQGRVQGRLRNFRAHGRVVGDDEFVDYESDDQVEKDINDGMYDAVNELMGEGDTMSKVTPYLSAVMPFIQSFQGGDDKAKAEAAAKEAAAQAKKDAEAKAASNKKLYIVLGVLGGIAVLGGGIFMARKK